MFDRLLSKLDIHRLFHRWSWAHTANHDKYCGHRVTYVTCMKTGQVRLCDPLELRILSASEERAVCADFDAYLAIQQKVDAEHAKKHTKSWEQLLSEPKAVKAMEKRNAIMAVVAAARV